MARQESAATTENRRVTMVHFAVQGAFLFAIWLLLSGHYDLFHLALGVLSVTLVLLMNRTILPFVAGEGAGAGRLRPGPALLYVPWLAWQMVLSGLHVARVVLSPSLQIQPSLIRFKSRQPNDLARVILGNSITLTPGTLTIEIEGDEYLVHSLTRATADGLLGGEMQAKAARLFQEAPEEMVYDVRIASE